jgi:hypothetical protein
MVLVGHLRGKSIPAAIDQYGMEAGFARQIDGLGSLKPTSHYGDTHACP